MAANDETGYPGAKLDTTKPQIRLLTVFAGKEDQPIRCKLHTVDVDTAGRYQALSYAWGVSPSDSSILVNERVFPVGKNLFDALIHLRLPDLDRVLWIDAVCINQDDISERNHQVQQMADIYSRAKQVISWLGLGTLSSQDAMDFLREVYTAGPLSRNKFKDDERWEDIELLCRRDYWRRLWVIQEICLASSVIVICGSDQIPWECFTEMRKTRSTIWPKSLSDGEKMFMQSYTARIDEQRINRMKQGAVLWTLLETFKASLCKDFHDRVYGLLALSTDCGVSGIPIDYSISCKELYEHVVGFYHKQYQLDSSPSAGAQLMKLAEFLQGFFFKRFYFESMDAQKGWLSSQKESGIIRIPICNMVVIEKFVEPGSYIPRYAPVENPQEQTEYPYPDRLRPWDSWDARIFGRSASSHPTDGSLPGYTTFHIPLPKLDIINTGPTISRAEFIAKPIRPTRVAPGWRHREPPKLTEWYFVGIAPPGAQPGDIVCSFVESNVAVVVRPGARDERDVVPRGNQITQQPLRPLHEQDQKLKPLLLSARRPAGDRKTLNTQDTSYLKSVNAAASLRFRRRHKERRRKMVLEEVRKREEGENVQGYGCIIGRAFFDFLPMSKLDGISTRLTRDKRLETTNVEDDGVSPWPGTLTVDMETLQSLSGPGIDKYERMTHTGVWVPLGKSGEEFL